MDNLSLSTGAPSRLLPQAVGHISPISRLVIEPPTRHELIAQAAYFRAQHRRFEPEHELEDWLLAEAEVDVALQITGTASSD